jgi:hypothetical protein
LYGVFDFACRIDNVLHLVATAYYKATQRKSRKVFRLPLSRHWNVPIKATFSQAAGPFTQIAGCASKALTKPVYPSMMRIQLNNDLIVLVTGAN